MVKKSNKKEVIDDIDILKMPVELRDTFYSNGLKILGSQYEFVLDFIELPPKDNELLEGIRIYINPINFKLFTELFNEQLKKHEKQFGEIKTK